MFTIKRLTFLSLLLLLGTFAQAQSTHNHAPGRTCHADIVLQQQLQQDPALQQRMRDIEQMTQDYIRTNGTSRNNQSRIIPVYVHVIYRTSQENISTAQIQSQIDVLNRDYGGQNADLNNVPSAFQSVTATGTGIQFSLVNITRKQTTRSSWGTNDAMKSSSQGGVDPLTPNTHLNIWICNIGNNILGYAQFPGGAASTDGVVISPQFFGSSDLGSGFYLNAPFDKGRTAVHEVGHYLNLRHIWGDGNCSYDDRVDDTPTSSTANYGCPSYPTYHCSTSDMFMNYMDYVDDRCMFMFSKGQEARMWAALNGPRTQLGYSGGGNTGGGNTGGGTACNDIEVTLDLNFDNYGSETSWELHNNAGQVVASGSGYTNSSTTIQENFCLEDGCYDFVINDSYGDGICCSYGNGSYSLTDEDGNVLASGGSFGASETKQICVSSAPACYDVTLDLNFDNYGSETSWYIKDASGTTLHQGNGYINSSPDLTEDFCLPAGCYTFEILDSYGDGICCSYGNGSYSIAEKNGATLISGGAFGSKETKQFCVGTSNRQTTTVSTSKPAIEATQKVAMNIYPNPAFERLTIEWMNTDQAAIGHIIDATGKQLWEGQIDAGTNHIMLTNIPSGMYYFTVVQDNGKVVSKKFIKAQN